MSRVQLHDGGGGGGRAVSGQRSSSYFIIMLGPALRPFMPHVVI